MKHSGSVSFLFVKSESVCSNRKPLLIILCNHLNVGNRFFWETAVLFLGFVPGEESERLSPTPSVIFSPFAWFSDDSDVPVWMEQMLPGRRALGRARVPMER